MEDPQNSWNTADIAEVDTTIDHLIEYGIQHRQIAPAYNFDDPDPTAFTQDWCIEEPIEMPQEGPFGTIGLRRVLNKSQAKSQMLRQKLKALAKNRLLQERVILELRRRLLVSGTSKEQVNETDNHLPTLTQMYYNTKNPPSKLAKVIEVRVVTGLPGTLSTANPTTLKLPIDVSFKNVVRTLLKDCVSTELICSAGSGVSNKELDQILEKWRYQLLKKNDKGKLRFEDLSYTQLVLDDDYRNMVKKVIGQGQQIMIPLLTPVNKVRSIKTKPLVRKALDESSDTPQPEDDFMLSDAAISEKQAFEEWFVAEEFKPVDWENVVKRIEGGVDVTKCDLSFIDRERK